MRTILSKTWAKVGLALLCLPTSWAYASGDSQGASISPNAPSGTAAISGEGLATYSARSDDFLGSLP